MATRPALAVLLAAAAAPALAQSPAQGQYAGVQPEACAPIESDTERLACYDAAHGRGRQPAAPATPLSEVFGVEPEPGSLRWRIEQAGVPSKPSLLDARWELQPESKLGVFNLRTHRPVFLLPGYWSSRPNVLPSSANPANTVPGPVELRSVEQKFQISFKTKALENLFGDNGDLWLGYTQSSRWQVFDGDNSRPFRETNYNPEALLVFRTGYRVAGWNARMAAVGLSHQSNGRSLPLSRSWDRVIAQVGLERDDWVLMLRPWWRIPESRNSDDNPDITDFMGRGDIHLTHLRGDHAYTLMARHSLRGGDRSRGALQFDWSFPLYRALRGHLQVFDGYGESMIDYNHRATYVGVGVSLVDWY